MNSSSIVDFLESRVSLVGESLHRFETDLPKWFVCGITAISLPSDKFLHPAKYSPGLMPNGWRSDRPDFCDSFGSEVRQVLDDRAKKVLRRNVVR
jgi:hypothetical protein